MPTLDESKGVGSGGSRRDTDNSESKESKGTSTQTGSFNWDREEGGYSLEWADLAKFELWHRRNPSGQTAPGDLMCEVALKIMSKKRVKGSGESMWSEMRVAPGSQQRESCFPTHLFSMMCLRTCPRLSPNMFGCLSVGQI